MTNGRKHHTLGHYTLNLQRVEDGIKVGGVRKQLLIHGAPWESFPLPSPAFQEKSSGNNAQGFRPEGSIHPSPPVRRHWKEWTAPEPRHARNGRKYLRGIDDWILERKSERLRLARRINWLTRNVYLCCLAVSSISSSAAV